MLRGLGEPLNSEIDLVCLSQVREQKLLLKGGADTEAML